MIVQACHDCEPQRFSGRISASLCWVRQFQLLLVNQCNIVPLVNLSITHPWQTRCTSFNAKHACSIHSRCQRLRTISDFPLGRPINLSGRSNTSWTLTSTSWTLTSTVYGHLFPPSCPLSLTEDHMRAVSTKRQCPCLPKNSPNTVLVRDKTCAIPENRYHPDLFLPVPWATLHEVDVQHCNQRLFPFSHHLYFFVCELAVQMICTPTYSYAWSRGRTADLAPFNLIALVSTDRPVAEGIAESTDLIMFKSSPTQHIEFAKCKNRIWTVRAQQRIIRKSTWSRGAPSCSKIPLPLAQIMAWIGLRARIGPLRYSSDAPAHVDDAMSYQLSALGLFPSSDFLLPCDNLWWQRSWPKLCSVLKPRHTHGLYGRPVSSTQAVTPRCGASDWLYGLRMRISLVPALRSSTRKACQLTVIFDFHVALTRHTTPYQ